MQKQEALYSKHRVNTSQHMALHQNRQSVIVNENELKCLRPQLCQTSRTLHGHRQTLSSLWHAWQHTTSFVSPGTIGAGKYMYCLYLCSCQDDWIQDRNAKMFINTLKTQQINFIRYGINVDDIIRFILTCLCY